MFDLSRAFIDENRRLGGLVIILSPESLYEAGILKNILDIFAKNSIPILQLNTSKTSGEKVSILIFYELKDKEFHKNIINIIKNQIPHVEDVKVINEVMPGVIIDDVNFPVTVLNERAILLRKPLYKEMLLYFKRKLGSIGNVYLYHVGYSWGKAAAESHMKLAKGDIKRAIDIGSRFFHSVGFGRMKIKNFNMQLGRITIDVYDSFECEVIKEEGIRKPSSELVRGILSGWFSSLLRYKIVFKETKCIALGDEYCEFDAVKERSIE
ncbi:MAG: hypothetical protein DRJ35_03355 [Thermoprotei archaeon]|nr:MAG: hypothetical protein DRJ35_03355 [Thermoprotei archaeon]